MSFFPFLEPVSTRHHHDSDTTEALLEQVLKQVTIMHQYVTELLNRMDSLETTANSAIDLLRVLSTSLQDAVDGEDLVAIKTVSDRIAVKVDEISRAIESSSPRPSSTETPPAPSPVLTL